jgi:cation diffusion facilitator CzcD-associated flavoprotein CzcO
MKIAIVGAGFAGLSSARVLHRLGHEVTVYEKTPDVGGVWSGTRRYPGLRTQNDKGTYALSELQMPGDYPEWPSGEQVQQYLETYVERFGLAPYLRLDTPVTWAEPTDDGWAVTAAGSTEAYDHLVLASGVFSKPFIPPLEGIDILEKVGGVLIPASDLHSLEQVRGKHAVIIGYGKSACDITVEVAKVATSTTVVARALLWKMPRKIKNVLNFKYLMLTRLGEGLFRYQTVRGAERVLHAKSSALANNMLGSVEKVAVQQLGLLKLGLVPSGDFSDIAKSTVSLATEGFYEGVADGSITVKRDTTVARFGEVDGRPIAELTNGETIRADVVLAATGWTQDIPFLSDEVMDRLVDENGDYVLYRHIHPVGVANLSFAGYNSSLFSPLSAEVSALWIGSLLGGNHRLPTEAAMRAEVAERLAWMRQRTGGAHARGTNIIPFSVHNIDEVLSDVGIDVGRGTRARQWLLPIDPSDYSEILPKLAQRMGI